MADRDFERAISRMLAPLSRRVLLMASRIVLTAATDKAPVQVVQFTGLADEVKQNVEYLQPFGHTSVPPAGARGLAIYPGGDRSHGVVVVLDARALQPVTLKTGESAVWDALGQFLHLKDDGTVVLRTSKFRVEGLDGAPGVIEATGDIKDRCESDGSTMDEIRTVYDDHDHPETDTTTGKPNQVMG